MVCILLFLVTQCYISHYISLLNASTEYNFSFTDLLKASSLCSKYSIFRNIFRNTHSYVQQTGSVQKYLCIFYHSSLSQTTSLRIQTRALLLQNTNINCKAVHEELAFIPPPQNLIKNIFIIGNFLNQGKFCICNCFCKNSCPHISILQLCLSDKALEGHMQNLLVPS